MATLSWALDDTTRGSTMRTRGGAETRGRSNVELSAERAPCDGAMRSLLHWLLA